MSKLAALTVLPMMLGLMGCSNSTPAPAPADTKKEGAATEAHHEHKPPHHGTLVEFGEEFSHLELVLDPATGTLKAYVLDGEAEKTIRIAVPELEIKAQLSGADGKKTDTILKLSAQADELTGEKVGDTSVFQVQNDALKGVKDFDGTVSVLTIKGKEFKDTKFNYPKGNEAEEAPKK